MAAAEQHVFEMIAEGAPLAAILDALALAIEEHSPPAIGSILLLDADGLRVRHGAAPSLPEGFVAAIDGAPIGPQARLVRDGRVPQARRRSSRTSRPTRSWDDYRELARAPGLRACWSTPILATDGRVLGTFALYYREPRAPTDARPRAHRARDRTSRGSRSSAASSRTQLRALSAHVESAREDERTGIAREIHDELGQCAHGAQDGHRVDRAARRGATRVCLARSSSRSSRAMSAMTDEIIDQVRRISSELRPGVLDDLGLVAAIEWQAEEFESANGPDLRRSLEPADDAPLDRDALDRALPHLSRRRSRTSRGTPRRRTSTFGSSVDAASWLELEVRDDGVGHRAGGDRQPGVARACSASASARGASAVRRPSPARPTGGTVVSRARPALAADERVMIKVLVADDHAVVRRGLRQILAETPDIVGRRRGRHAARGACELVARERWNVVVLDIKLAGRQRPRAPRRAPPRAPELPVLDPHGLPRGPVRRARHQGGRGRVSSRRRARPRSSSRRCARSPAAGAT